MDESILSDVLVLLGFLATVIIFGVVVGSMLADGTKHK